LIYLAFELGFGIGLVHANVKLNSSLVGTIYCFRWLRMVLRTTALFTLSAFSVFFRLEFVNGLEYFGRSNKWLYLAFVLRWFRERLRKVVGGLVSGPDGKHQKNFFSVTQLPMIGIPLHLLISPGMVGLYGLRELLANVNQDPGLMSTWDTPLVWCGFDLRWEPPRPISFRISLHYTP